MKIKRILSYAIPALLFVLGCVGGYLYYRLVGCASGSCAITSNPYVSTIYGGVIGLLLGLVIAPAVNKKNDNAVPDRPERW